MNKIQYFSRTRRTLALLAITGVLGAAACGELTKLEQANPGQLQASTLFVPANAQLLVNGAIGDFECAFSRYALGSGVLGDELANAISNSANFDYDRRTLQTNAAYGTGTCASAVQSAPVYTTLSTARASADTIAAKLQGWTDAEVGANRTRLLGQAYAYAGYSLVLLGEGMCSAAINLGPEMTPAQIFAQAKIRFDSAVAIAARVNDATTLSLATMGRARTSQNLGNLSAAAADAATITSSSYVANISTDATNARRQNAIYLGSVLNFFVTVDPSFRGLTFAGVSDPRVSVVNSGKTGTTGAAIWQANKALLAISPVAITRWSEAQLIQAENAVATGNLAGAAAFINALHTNAGLPAYDPTGQTATQVLAQVIEERRREFFLEGHRLGDIRRYALVLSPATGSAFPNGGTYGAQSCFPLPDVERINNPKIALTP
jgi:hypothetical protein